MIIRLAQPDDVPNLHALIEQSIRGLQTGDYTPAQIEGAIGHALGLDTQLIADQHYFIAEDESGKLAACGGWSNRKTLFGSDHGPSREDDFLDPATDAARIRAIFVHPSFARQGIGSLMLRYCEQGAAAAGFRRFEMGSTLTGIALYRLKGYADGDLLHVPLPNGESLPILKMTKNLTTNFSS